MASKQARVAVDGRIAGDFFFQVPPLGRKNEAAIGDRQWVALMKRTRLRPLEYACDQWSDMTAKACKKA